MLLSALDVLWRKDKLHVDELRVRKVDMMLRFLALNAYVCMFSREYDAGLVY